jgi:hypothetical protein
MAASHEWPLTIQGAEQDYPRLLSLKRVGCGAEVVYKATVEGPVCLLTGAPPCACCQAHTSAFSLVRRQTGPSTVAL